MACTGVMYAGWSNVNRIETNVLTGKLDYKIATDTFVASYCDAMGQWQKIEDAAMKCSENDEIEVTLGRNSWISAENQHTKLQLSYQIVPDKENTIGLLALETADSVVCMEPQQVCIVKNEEEKELGDIAASAPTLTWEGKVEVTEKEKAVWITHEYELTQESRMLYLEAVDKIEKYATTEAEPEELEVHYTFHIPLNIAQGGN